MADDKASGLGTTTTIILLLVAVAIAGIAAYEIAAKQCPTGADKDKTIEQLQSKISEKDAQISKLTKQATSGAATSQPSAPVSTAETREINCVLCHDKDATKAFHIPQNIVKIDDAKSLRRRICIDCHGPLGAANADEQMTKLSDIVYKGNETGTGGFFEVPKNVVHDIHKAKLDSGALSCNFCHANYNVPKVNTAAGQVLVCQNCMAHPDEGNYVTIHVEMKGQKCTVCHTGNVVDVHKKGTAGLGQVQ